MTNLTSLTKSLQFALQYPMLAREDILENRRWQRDGKRFLVLRHPGRDFPYRVFLEWLEQEFPDLRTLFELRLMLARVNSWGDYALFIPWLQDPVQQWSPLAYRLAHRLEMECDGEGIPTVNRVDRLINAGKSKGAALMEGAGLRTPRMVLITDKKEFLRTKGGLSLPLFVRSDWGHGGPVFRADTEEQLRQLPLDRIKRPVAIEFVDVEREGLFRKYRYVIAGEMGIPQSMHVSKEWRVHGDNSYYTDALRDEEIAYINAPDPNHAALLTARKALGLDFVAFDYSYDKEGRMIVWEANPYPHLHLKGSERRHYRHAPTLRVFAAMMKLYLDKAGMRLPQKLAKMVV